MPSTSASGSRRRAGSASTWSGSCWSRRSWVPWKSCSTGARPTTGSARTFIIVTIAICVVAFCAMIPWCLSRKDPIIDMHMVGTRQFGSCFVVMLATGAILIATTPVPAGTAADPVRLYRDLGGAGALAGRTGHDDHVRGDRPTVEPGSAQMADHDRLAHHRGLDVLHDQPLRRVRLLVLRLVAHVSGPGPTLDLHPDPDRPPMSASRRRRPIRPPH